MAKRRKKRKHPVIGYEIAGLLMIACAALAFADLGWIGRTVDSLLIYAGGNWHWILGVYIAYLAVVMMILRGPVEWTKRQVGLLLLLVMLLTWSQLNLYTDVASQTADANHRMWAITMQGVDGLQRGMMGQSVPAVTDPTSSSGARGSSSVSFNGLTGGSAGGGAIGYVLFSASHYLFDTAGTLVVLVVMGIVCIALLTNRSVIALGASARIVAIRGLDHLWGWFGAMSEAWREQRARARIAKAGRQGVKPARSGSAKTGSRAATMNATTPGNNEHSGVAPMDDSLDFVSSLSPNEPDIEEEAERLDVDPLFQTGPDARIRVRFPMDDSSRVPTVSPHPSTTSEQDVDFTTTTLDSHPYQTPPLSLLNQPGASRVADQRELNANARTLEKTLESFGVQAKVMNYSAGPAVTRYEVQPATGVRVQKIVSLQNDLQLALAAGGIRLEAPIPGKSAVGIEVPNKEVAVVSFREVLASSEFQQSDRKLSIALGRDIAGNSIVWDLAKMPHLLVAGATGSGKSVCVNGIITSILFKARPDEVKFIMIDPKVVELNVYNGIPHMMAPVVTDPRRAAQALKKVVAEMEKRYEWFANKGVRDLEQYNAVMRQAEEKTLPFIVVIIDELADLMMVASSDVEDAICRLAQKARASGIHLIVATQRPSVDVITGTIKANIPSRIAFAVSSSADSKTILDSGGADKLLGRGDMLFLPVGASKSTRVQGAFIHESEVERVVNFAKEQQSATYSLDLTSQGSGEETTESERDDLFQDAVTLVVESGQASASYLQRRLSVGYARASRLIDVMESKGYVGAYQGSKPRELLLTKEAWAAMRRGQSEEQ